jgi:hypothetical protein
LAALPAFADLLEREPTRIHNNRYIFFVPNEPGPTTKEVVLALHPVGTTIRFFASSIERQLDSPEWQGPLAAAAAISSSEYAIDLRKSMGNELRPREQLFGLAKQLNGEARLDFSERLLLGGSLVLSGFRGGIAVSEISELLNQGAWLYGTAALERASASHWGADAERYCEDVQDFRSPDFDEYSVKAGDILSRICRERYQIPFVRVWPSIRELNPEIVDPNRIQIGQLIRLPRL